MRKAVGVYHIQTREWINRVKMCFWIQIFNSIWYRIQFIYEGLLLDCCFSEKTESFELMCPPSLAPPRTYPRMHFNELSFHANRTVIVEMCAGFSHTGKQHFSFCSRAFPPSPGVCQHKSSSNTQSLHATQQVPLHVSLPILNQTSPRMLVPHYHWKKSVTSCAYTTCEQKTHILFFPLSFSVFLLSHV